ncbi:hypothetical protein D3C77_215870 [compost metagenome]
MSQVKSKIVECEDPKDGSGELIVVIPPEVLAELGLGVGDRLSLEMLDGKIVLKPVCDTKPTI